MKVLTDHTGKILRRWRRPNRRAEIEIDSNGARVDPNVPSHTLARTTQPRTLTQAKKKRRRMQKASRRRNR